MSSPSLPVIDIRAWFGGSSSARRAVAALIGDACSTSGFFQIVGHGIHVSVLEDALNEIDGFFQLPIATKMAVAPPASNINRGFLALGSETISYTVGVDSPTDLREAFVIGPEMVPDDDIHGADPYRVFAPNYWPDDRDKFRSALLAYFDAAGALAHTLVDIYAVALGLDEHHFRPSLDHSTETLRVNYYERLTEQPADEGQHRLGAHTDYGITTVLYADSMPGLQLLDEVGVWHDVIAEPGALIVNLGDLLAQWTNDRWRSTIHRVVASDGLGDRRRSIAFFLDGNYDAIIECLPTCCDVGNPPRYAPTTAGEHLVEKLRGARTHSKSETLNTVGDRALGIER